MQADREEHVITVLKAAGLRAERRVWRRCGDREINFSTIGSPVLIEGLKSRLQAESVGDDRARPAKAGTPNDIEARALETRSPPNSSPPRRR